MHNFIKLSLLFSMVYFVAFTSCKKDEEDVVDPIPSSFLIFDSTNTNYPKMACTSEPVDDIYSYFWDFGNGKYAYNDTVTAYYPFPGRYKVVLYITSAGGTSSSAAFYYECDTIDPNLTDNPYYRNLTFTIEPDTSFFNKRWVLSDQRGAISIGPSEALLAGLSNDFLNDSIIENYYYPENYLQNSGGAYSNDDAYKNAMTFYLEDYVYKNTDSAKWIVNWVFANNEFGYSQAEDQDVCIDITHALDTAGTYELEFTDEGAVFINLPDKNFLLYYEGKPSKVRYQVLCLREDLLVVRKLYYHISGTPLGYRYLRYVPEQYRDSQLPLGNDGNPITGSIINPPTE